MSAAVHPLTDGPTRPGHRPHLQVAGTSSTVDLDRAELLAALGQDPAAEPLLDTPRRVAASYAELLTPAPFTLTTFPNDEGYDELVLARAIPFASLSQHHLLPSPAWPTSATCRPSGSWGCRSWPGWSSCSPAACRSRSGSPPRSPTGSRPTWSPRASGWCWRPSTDTGSRQEFLAFTGISR